MADRLAIVILMLALASIDLQLSSLRLKHIAVTVTLALIIQHTAGAVMAWRRADRAYAPIISAMRELPPGARVYSILNFDGIHFLDELRLPWMHMGSYATILSHDFCANVWAVPGQDPILVQPSYASLAEAAPSANRVQQNQPPSPASDMLAPELLEHADYLLAGHADLYPRPIPSNLVPLVSSEGTTLFRIDHLHRKT